MSGNSIPSCRTHSSANYTPTEDNKEQYSTLGTSVSDLAGTLAGMIGALGLEGNAARSADRVLEGLSARLRFQSSEIDKLANACQKATTGAIDTQSPAETEVLKWEEAEAEIQRLESQSVPPEEMADVQAKIAAEEAKKAEAELEGGRIITQLDTNTNDAITLLPDFMPPSSPGAAPVEDSGVNGSGVTGTAGATSTLSSSGFQGGANGSVQTAQFSGRNTLGATGSTASVTSQATATGSTISASTGASIQGQFSANADVDPTVLSASSRTLGADAAAEFASNAQQETISASSTDFSPTLAADSGATGGMATVSASSKASQVGAVVSPALMAAGLPKILKATQVTGNLLNLRGATGGSSPISAQGAAGRPSLSASRGAGATTMGARPATAGAGGRASNLSARSRTTAGARSGTLKASGGTTAPRAAASTGKATSARASRALSPRTPVKGATGRVVGTSGTQGTTGRPVGSAGAQGAPARAGATRAASPSVRPTAASSKSSSAKGTQAASAKGTQAATGRGSASTSSARGASTGARGALGRAQRALGLGRGASEKKKDKQTQTEHIDEQLLTTDSRLNFLGRGQRDDIEGTNRGAEPETE